MNSKESARVDYLVNKLVSGEDITVETPTGGFRICACGVGTNEAVLDTIYAEHKGGKLTLERLKELARLQDKQPIGAPFDINKVPFIDIAIKLFVDGDKWCALIGDDLQVGLAGFGRTRKQAINELFDRYFSKQGRICRDCGQPTRHFWPEKFWFEEQGDIGRCNTCHFKHLVEKHPAPELSAMSTITSGLFKDFRKWPHHYIPRYCPYCNVEIHHIHIGSYNGHSCYENICETCKVYFGFTD